MTRVLIIIHRMMWQYGTAYFVVEIPSWRKGEFRISPSNIPTEILQRAHFEDGKKRVYADVNLDAQSVSELKISNCANLNLYEVFRKGV